MAYANDIRTGKSAPTLAGFADRIAALYHAWAAAQLRRESYRRTVRELESLSDRDLADMGIHRAMIAELAAEAVAKA